MYHSVITQYGYETKYGRSNLRFINHEQQYTNALSMVVWPQESTSLYTNNTPNM